MCSMDCRSAGKVSSRIRHSFVPFFFNEEKFFFSVFFWSDFSNGVWTAKKVMSHFF